MNIDNLEEQQREILDEKLDLYMETAKFSIENQSNSFNSIDTKVDILLASLGVFVSFVLTIIGFKTKFFDNLIDLQGTCKYLVIGISLVYIILVITTFIVGFIANKSRSFSFGRDVIRIRDLDDKGLTNLKIKKDISDGLEISYHQNATTLAKKIKFYQYTQILWLINFLITIILIFIILTL